MSLDKANPGRPEAGNSCIGVSATTVIGITGPTGAGKTTALSEVEKLGGAVIDCDAVYHQMLESDIALQRVLEETFGPLRGENGRIDRKRLGAIVFRDPEKLERLNEIVRQSVCAKVSALVEALRAQGQKLAAIDAFALVESPLSALCDVTLAVTAPPEVRIRRIMAREGISEEYARSRVRSQKPDCYYQKRCDYTLVNDCDSAQEFGRKSRALLESILIKDIQ